MFEIMVVCAAVAGLMAALFAVTLVLTVIIKICHPHWSWKRCAKESTLIS